MPHASCPMPRNRPAPRTAQTTRPSSLGPRPYNPPVPSFDIPLDIPHAGRLADRIFSLLEEQCDEYEFEADALLGAAQRLSSFLFRYTESDENPLDALRIRDEAARLGRELVAELERSGVTGDRLGQ